MIGCTAGRWTSRWRRRPLGKADETIVIGHRSRRCVAAVGGQFDDHQRCFGAAQDHGDLGRARDGDHGARRLRARPARSTPRDPRPGRGIAGGRAVGARSPRQCAAAARAPTRHSRLGRTGARHRRARCSRGVGARADARISTAPTGSTGTPATSWRRRSWPPRTGCGGATPSRPARWRSTPSAMAPARGRASAHPTSSMCQPIPCSSSSRRGWAGRSAPSSCPRGATRRSCRRRRSPT